jgi:single-stranded-DNA-specific exonuclease
LTTYSSPARWIALPVPAAAEALVAAGHPLRLAQMLALRGVENPAAARAFLEPRIEDLHDPEDLPGFKVGRDRLVHATELGERIVVVGDYDVDGVTATALLAATLRSLGATVETILPRRDAEGYGLQPLHLERAAGLGATLLVAVDSGTNAFAAMVEARRVGVDLLIVDHHLPEERRPDSALLINPRLGDGYPYLELTAAGLVLKLVATLLEHSGRPVPWDALLRVAMLGTIADVAPLVGENRVIAALGLRALASVRSPGLRALIEIAGVRAPVAAADVAFRLAPRLNAAGRLGSADAALELLLTRDVRRARELASELHGQNAERQRIEERLLSEARAELEARGRPEGPPPIIVAWREGWHRGVVGIAAARLAREVNRPALLLSVDGPFAVGSGRSTEGIALHEFLRPWAVRLERFGGHAQAVGLTVRADRLPALRAEWEKAAAAWAPRLAERTRRYDLALDLAEVGDELVAQLDRMEPCGSGNPEPVFRFGPCRLAGEPREFGRGHLGFLVAGAQGGSGASRTTPTVAVVAWRARESGLELAGSFELLAAVLLSAQATEQFFIEAFAGLSRVGGNSFRDRTNFDGCRASIPRLRFKQGQRHGSEVGLIVEFGLCRVRLVAKNNFRNADVSPRTGLPIDDLQPRGFALQITHVQRFTPHGIAVVSGDRLDRLIVDQQIDACRARMPAAANPKVDVIPLNNELGAGKRAGFCVLRADVAAWGAGMGVDDARSLRAYLTLIRGNIGLENRPFAKGFAGHFPAFVSLFLKIGKGNVRARASRTRSFNLRGGTFQQQQGRLTEDAVLAFAVSGFPAG